MSVPRPGSPILSGIEVCHFTVCPGLMPESLRGGKTYFYFIIIFLRPYFQATYENQIISVGVFAGLVIERGFKRRLGIVPVGTTLR